jgi:hypothetical protein
MFPERAFSPPVVAAFLPPQPASPTTIIAVKLISNPFLNALFTFINDPSFLTPIFFMSCIGFAL